MRKLRSWDWLTAVLLACLAVATIAVLLAAEMTRAELREFYKERPLQAGIVTGVALAALATFVVNAVRANLHERRWKPLSHVALLSLVHETTLLLDTFLWLATGQTPVGDAAPTDDAQQELLKLRDRANLPEPPPPESQDLGQIQHEPYVRDLKALVTSPAWRAFAVRQLDNAKFKNREGIAVWAAAMLSTGESADVLNRLASLNEGVSRIQDHLRIDAPTVLDRWLEWHAEAVSIREDLLTVSRGKLPAEWPAFRNPLNEDVRKKLADRNARRRVSGVRGILAKSLCTVPPAPAAPEVGGGSAETATALPGAATEESIQQARRPSR